MVRKMKMGTYTQTENKRAENLMSSRSECPSPICNKEKINLHRVSEDLTNKKHEKKT